MAAVQLLQPQAVALRYFKPCAGTEAAVFPGIRHACSIRIRLRLMGVCPRRRARWNWLSAEAPPAKTAVPVKRRLVPLLRPGFPLREA